MRTKNTHMRIKFLLSWVCFILPVTEHAYFSMRIAVYTHAFFLRLTKNKIRTRHAYFSGIYKEIFLRCDVTRLLSEIVRLLAFETFNAGSVLTKIKTLFLRKPNKNFMQSLLGSFV